MSVGPARVTAADEAVAAWERFTHRHLSRRTGAEQALREVLTADPGLAAGHAAAALLALLAGSTAFDPAAEVAAARAATSRHDWERSFTSAVGTTADAGMWAAAPQWLAHHDAFPEDLLGFEVVAYLLDKSTAPDALDRVGERVRRSVEAVGEHPLLVGFAGMLAQERGELDEAHRLATRALELDPTGFDGGHPMTHVFFEAGDHGEGLAWLDAWLPTADREAPFAGHLAWHAGLHALALGEADLALERYRSCAARPGAGGLVDGSSLLWRCQLHGHVPPGDDPLAPPVAELAAGVREAPPTLFLGVHVVLALAATADADGLRRFARAAAGFTAPGASELVPDLADGFAALLEGDAGRAATLLLAQEPRFGRYGGSHAQREVFEDTLLEALVRAGRLAEAATRLQRRLDRRESRLDARLLARARS